MTDYIGRKVRLIGADWPDALRGTEDTIAWADNNDFRNEAGWALGFRGEDGEFVPRPDHIYDYRTELVEETHPLVGRKVKLTGSGWATYGEGFPPGAIVEIESVDLVFPRDGYEVISAKSTGSLGRWVNGEFVPYSGNFAVELLPEEEPTVVNLTPSSDHRLVEAWPTPVDLLADDLEEDVRLGTSFIELPKVRVTISVGEISKSLYLDLDGHSAKLAGQMAEKLVEMIYEGEI